MRKPGRKVGYRVRRPSRKMRTQMWGMYQQLYTKDTELASKKDNETAVATSDSKEIAISGTFEWIDSNGIKQSVNLEDVKSLSHTDYFIATEHIFPNATQCCVKRPDSKTGEVVAFDDKGRPNILNQPVCLLEARWMETGEFGPWFLMRGYHPEYGEISVPATGSVVEETIAGVFAIDIKTGESTGMGESAVWARWEFIPEGEYGGYFILAGPETFAEAD